MARIKLAYIGGGSTRAPGTVASFVAQGENFAGSELVLIDLDEERLKVVETIGWKLARARGLDLKITATTDRRDGLRDCSAVLTSYRPGGFEARHLDENIPLKHGVIGQETQGPGGFFMALRTIPVMKKIIADMEAVCPNARLFNYTNPVNIVSEAVTHHTAIPTISFCEQPILDRGYLDRRGAVPFGEYGRLPGPARGLVQMLGEFQALAAEAAWSGTRRDAMRALASHPLVLSLHKAEAIYDELSAALHDYLPARLLRN